MPRTASIDQEDGFDNEEVVVYRLVQRSKHCEGVADDNKVFFECWEQ